MTYPRWGMTKKIQSMASMPLGRAPGAKAGERLKWQLKGTAGGAARGVSGNAVWGYLSGNGLLSAVAGGAIAAETAKGMVNA